MTNAFSWNELIFILWGGVFFMRLIDLHNEFMFHIQVKGYTPRTLKSYNDKNKRFIAYLESEFHVTELDEVKTLHN